MFYSDYFVVLETKFLGSKIPLGLSYSIKCCE